MDSTLKDWVPALGFIVALLLFLRRRKAVAREPGEADLVVRSVDTLEKAYRIWGIVVGLFVVGVVVFLAFTEKLIATILLVTLAVMVAIVAFAPRKGRDDSHLGGGT
jgi:hypothetical protein